MKRLIMVSAALLTIHTLHAQHLSLGPSAGFGHAWMSNTDNIQFKPTVNIGASFIYSVVPHFGIGADLRLHFMEGVCNKYDNGSVVERNTLNATYLRLPVKFIYFFGAYGDRLRPKIYAGPSFGVLLGGNTVLKREKSDYRMESNSRDLLRDFDFGLTAGAGINFRVRRATWLNLDLAYTHGLTDAGRAPGYQANRNLGIAAGLTFPVGSGTKSAKK